MQRRLPLPEFPVPWGITLRLQTADDAAALGELYWHAYPIGAAAVDIEDAVEEMEGVFEGEYGDPVPEACIVAVGRDDRLVGCIQVVTDAPWEGTPDGPFVIELFVHRSVRGRGLARGLLSAASTACLEQGYETFSLNALPESSPDAFSLYRELGFELIE